MFVGESRSRSSIKQHYFGTVDDFLLHKFDVFLFNKPHPNHVPFPAPIRMMFGKSDTIRRGGTGNSRKSTQSAIVAFDQYWWMSETQRLKDSSKLQGLMLLLQLDTMQGLYFALDFSKTSFPFDW